MSSNDKESLISQLEYEESELQALESCEAKGFTLAEYVEAKKSEINYLNARINKG